MEHRPTRIADQLRQRRHDLGLSLAEVAKRAGTSAATLSRYEHGWSRFELYTLRKLATALGCDLHVALQPARAAGPAAPRPRTAVRRLKRLFWDHPLSPRDLTRYPVWVAERVLEYGRLDDVHLLRDVMGREAFLEAAAQATRVSPKTRNLWSRILEKEGVPCTKKHSRTTAWNY